MAGSSIRLKQSARLPQWKAWLLSNRGDGIVAGLFIVAWLPRLFSLGNFITWDELMWVHRTVHFSQALLSGDWAATLRTGHPGVVTTWLGALGIGVQRLLLGVPSSREWTWLLQLPVLDPRDAVALRRLAPLLVAAKVPLTLVTALAVVGCWALARRLVGLRTALLGGFLIALDPFFLAHSRVLHLDALLANFMALGLLSLLVYLRDPGQRGWLILSAFATGLAALNKTPAFSLLPMGIALLLAWDFLPNRVNRIRAILLWGGVILGTYVAFWPAMWIAPLDTLRQVLAKTLGYAAQAEETADFFRGATVSDPGALFYPLAFLFRVSPITLLGLLGSPLLWWRRGRSERRTWTILWVYALLYGFVMALGAKKFDRYLLPLFLPANLLAAMGWSSIVSGLFQIGLIGWSRVMTWSSSHLVGWPRGLGDSWLDGGVAGCGHGQTSKLLKRRSDWWAWMGGAALVLFQALLVLPYHPHYLAWYNPLLGGLRQAVRTLPVGWGEGLEKAAAYLNLQPDAETLTVACGGVPGIAPKFRGRTLPLTPASLIEADVVVVYVSDRQGGASPVDEYIGGTRPQHVVRLQGVEYAWIYLNESYRAPLQVLASEAEAGDALVIAGPSLVAKHYDGPLPSYVLRGEESEGEVASVLRRLTAGRERIWYIRFPSLAGWNNRLSPAADTAYYQLASQAYLVREEVFPIVILSLYHLPEEIDFMPTELRTGDDPITFGDQLRLVRSWLSDSSIGWGQELGVELVWQAITLPDADNTAFLHLVDPNDNLWGQVDLPLLNRRGEGTVDWSVGVEEPIRYLLTPWAGIPPGYYELLVGVYRSGTQHLLSVKDGQGWVMGDTVSLGQVQVVSSPLQPTMEQLSIPQPMLKEMDKSIMLLGYNLSPLSVQPGGSLRLDLFWRVEVTPTEDYELSVEFEGGERRFAIPNAYYPSSRWRAGEVLRGQFDIPVPAALSQGEYPVRINLARPESSCPAGECYLLADPISLGPVQVVARARSFEVPTIPHPLNLQLADQITLLGYDLPDGRVKPGKPLPITLYWQAQGPIDVAYTVFTHLLGPEERVVAQKDNVPQDGAAPTTGWLPGEVIVDEYQIPVPSDFPPGPFQIEVGMYDPVAGERLPMYGAEGDRLPHDRVLLISLERKQAK